MRNKIKKKKINPIFEGNKTEIKKEVEVKPQDSTASIFQNLKFDDVISALDKFFNVKIEPLQQTIKPLVCPPHDWQEFSNSFVCKTCGKIIKKISQILPGQQYIPYDSIPRPHKPNNYYPCPNKYNKYYSY